MKILVPTTSVKIWGQIIGYLCVNIAALLFFFINFYIGTAMIVFLNGITWLIIKAAVNLEKWKKNTLEKEAFFQQSNFNLASYGEYSLLAVSNSTARIVNIKSLIQIREIAKSSRRLVSYRQCDISEIYKNYPREGRDLVLNGKNVYYFDLTILEIKSVQPLLHKDADELQLLNGGSVKNPIFGIRITTKHDVIYDIDTSFSQEFCNELNAHLS